MKVAIIPARGGSKRIPGKNIREFAGKPMICHSIECALESNLFDRVIVSTDDDEISDVARAAGAEVPFRRPANISDDHTITGDVIAHAIEWQRQSGVEPTAICCIYATAPFIRQDDLRSALKLFESGDWSFVFAATSFVFPIQRSFQSNDDGGLEMFFPEHFTTRSQDLPEALHDAGQFYWGKPQAWLDGERIFGENSTVVSIPSWRVQDIDTLEDWERAEIMWQVLKKIELGE